MKLVVVIIHDEDAQKLVDQLTDQNYGVTKLASTGGFLSSGNTTLLVGVEKGKVDSVIDVIKETCKSRKEMVPTPAPIMGSVGILTAYPIEVNIGGATIFVLDVDRFEKA
ncbi:cyclic-di-AMP receptor [Lutibacter sp. B2]|nr:cyclic-di-AMP receptor [Lutibacter sp. B2]